MMTQNHNFIKFIFVLFLILVVGCSQQPAKETLQPENFTNTLIPVNSPVISTQTPEILQTVNETTETSADEHQEMSDIASLSLPEALQKINKRVSDNFIRSGWLHTISHK